jgi:hypothetical protein
MLDFHGTSRVLLHAANLRHGTDGFTSAPKEGVLRIFSPLKIWRLRPGLDPRTWVLKASTLPLDHRSRCVCGLETLSLGRPGLELVCCPKKNCWKWLYVKVQWKHSGHTCRSICWNDGVLHRVANSAGIRNCLYDWSYCKQLRVRSRVLNKAYGLNWI